MKYYISLLAALLLSTLNVQAQKVQHKGKGVSAKDIDSMIAFTPTTSVVLLSANGASENDSLSKLAETLQLKALNNAGGRMKLTRVWQSSDSILNRQVAKEIRRLFEHAADGDYLEDLTPPKTIDSVLNAIGMRYALFMEGAGFIRTDVNYQRASRDRSNAAVVRMGNYLRKYELIPLKAGVVSAVMIIDNKEHKTCWFKIDKSVPDEEWSPTEYITYKQQLQYLFNHFFWTLN